VDAHIIDALETRMSLPLLFLSVVVSILFVTVAVAVGVPVTSENNKTEEIRH
jgi:hypothetical protein